MNIYNTIVAKLNYENYTFIRFCNLKTTKDEQTQNLKTPDVILFTNIYTDVVLLP